MAMIHLRGLILGLALLLPWPALAQDVLEQDLRAIMAEGGLPSLAYAVIREGRVEEMRVLGDAPPAALYRAGSLSKTVTTLMILSLVDEGRLALDQPVTEVLPELDLRNPWQGESPLRLVHLLEQTSGLAGTSYADYGPAPDDIAPLAVIAGRRFDLRWPPGRFFSYANINHTLAAAMAERVTGQSFDALVRARVFDPLGMTTAGFDLSQAQTVLPSVSETGTPEGRWHLDVRPSGALIAGIDDLARLTAALASDGRSAGADWLPPQSLRRMRAPETSLVAQAGYPLIYGMGLFPFVAGGDLHHGHWGRIDGFQTTIGTRPDRGDGFALISNGANRRAFHAARERLARHIAAGTVLTPPEAVGTMEPVFAGWWMPFTDDQPQRAWLTALFGLTRIQAEGTGLVLTQPLQEGAQHLLPAGPGRFRPAEFPVATHVFTTDVAGEIFLLGDQQLSFRRLPDWAGIGMVIAVAFVGFGLVLAIALGIWGLLRRRGAARICFGVAAAMILTLHGLHVLWGMLAPLSSLAALSEWSLHSATLAGLSGLWPLVALAGGICLWRGPRPGRIEGLMLSVVSVALLGSGVVLAAMGWMPLLTFMRP